MSKFPKMLHPLSWVHVELVTKGLEMVTPPPPVDEIVKPKEFVQLIVALLPEKVKLPLNVPPVNARYVDAADDVVKYDDIPDIVWYVEAAVALVK